MDDAARARVAAGEGQLVGAAGRVVVDARIELRLRRAVVHERRIRRRLPGDDAGRPREGVRRVPAGKLVGPAIVDRARVRAVDAEHGAAAPAVVVDVAIEGAEGDRGAVAGQLARRLRDEVDDAEDAVAVDEEHTGELAPVRALRPAPRPSADEQPAPPHTRMRELERATPPEARRRDRARGRDR